MDTIARITAAAGSVELASEPVLGQSILTDMIGLSASNAEMAYIVAGVGGAYTAFLALDDR